MIGPRGNGGVYSIRAVSLVDEKLKQLTYF